MIRFWNKVEKTEDCWLWTAAIHRDGYGKFWQDGTKFAHRVAWELERGAIPEGLDIDHVCSNKHCVNPDHLQLMKRSEHVSLEHVRGKHPAVTHCPQGHEYTPENTYVNRGKRNCRECKRAYDRKRRS